MNWLRSLLFNVYFVSITIFMGLLAFGVRIFARGHALRYAQLWTRLCIGGFKRICRVEILISGREHLSSEKVFLLASQHQSAFDTLVWMNLLERPAYIMKKELARIPLVGPMLLLSGMIPVNRSGKTAALKDLLRATDAAVKDGRQIIIFPEGTRTKPGEKSRLHPGISAISAHNNLKIFPVATDSGRCWPRRGFVKKSGTIHIAIGPALPPGTNHRTTLQNLQAQWSELEKNFSTPCG